MVVTCALCSACSDTTTLSVCLRSCLKINNRYANTPATPNNNAFTVVITAWFIASVSDDPHVSRQLPDRSEKLNLMSLLNCSFLKDPTMAPFCENHVVNGILPAENLYPDYRTWCDTEFYNMQPHDHAMLFTGYVNRKWATRTNPVGCNP